MSIFFAEGNVSDSEQSNNQEVVKNQKIKPTYDFGDDDDHETKKRTVQTEKDKKWNIIKTICNKVNTSLNNKDYQKAWDHLQQALKQVEKASKVIEKQGKYPSIFMKTLKNLEEQVIGIPSEQAKKNQKNAKSFSVIKQKLKNKVLPQFEAELKKFSENEEAYLSSAQEDHFSESESSSESEDEDVENRGDWRSDDIMVRRRYFLKKQVKRDSDRKQSHEIDETEKPKQETQPVKVVSKQPKFHLTEVHKKKKIEIKSVKEAENKIRTIISKFHNLSNKDERQEYLENLNAIVQQIKTYKDFEKLSFLLVDIPIRVQIFRQMKLTHFIRQNWLTLFSHIEIIYSIIKESQEDDLFENVQLFNEGSVEKITSGQELTIYKAIQAFLIILEAEMRKAFRFIDKSEVQYSERLQDLIKLLEFMYKVSRDMSFYDQLIKQTNELSFKVIENMYFMSTSFMTKLNTSDGLRFTELADENQLQDYVEPILRFGQENHVTKTILYLIFNHAINQREKAKELLIMSNIPDIINECDYYTQAIYNRCIVVIGINSFIFGKYFEVQQFLSEICGYGKNRDQTKQIIREFLAQGYSRAQLQKQIPRNKILPYYLHLNVELIESLELIASMILEIPYTLSEGGRITAKTFKKVYFEYQRSHFIAEPLNNRDLIYAASVELKQGNWKQCYERLLQLEIWGEIQKVQNSHTNMLRIIKEFSLKCYLLANRKCFRSISLGNLANKFEMDEKNIRKLTSKWLYNREIQGSINEKGFLILAQKKQSQMQKLCESLYNKLEDVRKSYEQVMEQRFNAPQENEQDEVERDNKLNRRFNLAMNEKLKAILSRRN